MTARDYRDDVIEGLADELHLVNERCAEAAERATTAEADRDAWRLVAVQAVHHLNERHVEFSRLEDRYHRFLRERRGIDREADRGDEWQCESVGTAIAVDVATVAASIAPQTEVHA